MRTALVEFALNGTPVLIAVPSEPGLDYVRSVICIPLPCGEHTCVLYHDGILPAWQRLCSTKRCCAVSVRYSAEKCCLQDTLLLEKKYRPAHQSLPKQEKTMSLSFIAV